MRWSIMYKTWQREEEVLLPTTINGRSVYHQRNTYYYCHDDCRCYYAERYGGIANVLYLPLGWVRSLVIVNIIDFALVLILNLFVYPIYYQRAMSYFATDVFTPQPHTPHSSSLLLSIPTYQGVDIDVHSSAALLHLYII